MMSLGFSVKNAGPLTSIGLNVLALDTATHLATGAYGWWKARERSKSLLEVVESARARVVPTSTFNKTTYEYVRRSDQLTGVVIQSGELQTTNLPKASTAIDVDTGLACVRALTTGLLCFYQTPRVTTMLAELIPAHLLQYDQTDSRLNFEGPLYASLKQFVEAVATEEDNSHSQKTLIDAVNSGRAGLLGNSPELQLAACEALHTDEDHLTVGMLMWVLTPDHRRDTSVYPTRSLLVWSVALVMSKLGFEIDASPHTVCSTEDYKDGITNNQASADQGIRDVILVTSPVGPTDPLMLSRGLKSEGASLKPQIIPLRAVPWVAFRAHRGKERPLADTRYLADIWNESFQFAAQSVHGLRWCTGRYCELVGVFTKDLELPSFHSDLIHDWHPDLKPLLGPVVARFVPLLEDEVSGWSAANIRYSYYSAAESSELTSAEAAVQDKCNIMRAIVLGTCFGVATHCAIENGKQLTLDTEVAFSPNAVIEHDKLAKWVTTVASGIRGHLSWELLLNFITGFALGLRPREVVPYRDLALGACANGESAASDLVVSPSPYRASLSRVHIARGRLLNVPVDLDDYVVVRNRQMPIGDLAVNPEPGIHTLRYQSDFAYRGLARVDMEPCWDADPRTVAPCTRYRGKIVGSLDIATVMDKMSTDCVDCTCHNFVKEINVPQEERWQVLNLHQIMQAKFSRLTVEDRNVFIDASGDEVELLIALGHLKRRHFIIANGCLICAYAKIRSSRTPEVTLIAAPYKG